MKKILYTIVSVMIISIFTISNVFAAPYNPNQYTSVDVESNLLPPGSKQSQATEHAIARGNFFLSADLKIINNGDGTIGAYAVALTRFSVDEAYITLYLDQWDEINERWKQVKYYEAEFYSIDYPDGLSMPTVDLSFINQPKGYYYRLRGVFGVVYNNEFEGFSSTTDGILLD